MTHVTAKGCGARIRARNAGRPGRGAGDRRDRVSAGLPRPRLKQGKASCGVGRQYTGSAGKITNCQIGVFAAYASAKGHAFLDRQLYLPKDWTGDRERRAQAHVPESVRFATTPSLAVGMVRRAIETHVPFAWVAADTVYGVGEVEMALRRAGKGYVLGVPATQSFNSWDKPRAVAGTAEAIANT